MRTDVSNRQRAESALLDAGMEAGISEWDKARLYTADAQAWATLEVAVQLEGLGQRLGRLVELGEMIARRSEGRS